MIENVTGAAAVAYEENRERRASAVAEAVVTALRALAERRPDDVTLLDGFADAELDGWPVRVPEAVRVVLRAAGGVTAGGTTYAFGPSGRPPRIRSAAEDATWALSPDGKVLTGTGGQSAADWGPVLTVGRVDEYAFTVEAPGFLAWLEDLTRRLAEESPHDRTAPSAASPFRVCAVPSIEVAEGPDAELAALVGRGHSLLDVVDLGNLPGYPCAISWEPYFTLDGATADTGGSDVDYRLVAGGRALLLESHVSGDFLGRPVRRHRVPEDAPDVAVSRLRELARRFPRLVTLTEGTRDAEIDRWPVAVPADVRTVVRALGEVRVAGMPVLRLAPGEPWQRVEPALHRLIGGDGTYWPLARVTYGPYNTSLAQVRIDPATGRWGYVVSVPADPDELRDEPELVLLAESLPALLLEVARIVEEAAERAAASGSDPVSLILSASRWFTPNTGEPWTRPVPVEEWTGDTDPLRAEAAAFLPGSHAADLRDSPVPTDLCFHRAESWRWGRTLDRLRFLGGGEVVVAVAETGDQLRPKTC
ncbi:hypothetical protein AB0K92_26775 [Streptomyces sp. NPDC052687]|uniref:hypothetical protein n=1 Tax=Streptomyces sp. NPDC052687 TaxID=3154759 RepID=UPI0034266732